MNDEFMVAVKSRRLLLQNTKTLRRFIRIWLWWSVHNVDSKKKIYQDRSGQAFWREITGDPDFHVKMIQAIVDAPIHRSEYFKNDGNRLVITMIYGFSNFHCVLSPVFDGHVLLKHRPATSFFPRCSRFLQGRSRLSTFTFGYISHV